MTARRPRLLDLYTELAQAIPPAYTEHIGRQLITALTTCPNCGRDYATDDPGGACLCAHSLA